MATTPVDEDIIDVLYRCRSEGKNLTGLDNNFFKEQHHQVHGPPLKILPNQASHKARFRVLVQKVLQWTDMN